MKIMRDISVFDEETRTALRKLVWEKALICEAGKGHYQNDIILSASQFNFSKPQT